MKPSEVIATETLFGAAGNHRIVCRSVPGCADEYRMERQHHSFYYAGESWWSACRWNERMAQLILVEKVEHLRKIALGEAEP